MFRPIHPLAFFKFIRLDSGTYTEIRTEAFIWIMGVDYSKTVKHNRVQVLSYSQYSLLSCLLVGFTQEHPEDFTQDHFQTVI